MIPLKDQKVTIYTLGSFGYHKVEAKSWGHEYKPYAQYARALFVTFVEKGKRKPHGFVMSNHPGVVILEGWGHPDPADWLSQTADGNQRSRYTSFDERYAHEFDAMIDAYIRVSSDVYTVNVLIDERYTKNPNAVIEAPAVSVAP